MTDHLKQKTWAELDRSMKGLFLFVFCVVQIIVWQLVIYYNLIDDLFLSMGIAIIISVVSTSLVIKKVSGF